MDFVVNSSSFLLNHFFLLYCISLLLERLLKSREVVADARELSFQFHAEDFLETSKVLPLVETKTALIYFKFTKLTIF